jgi:hypothetical protein
VSTGALREPHRRGPRNKGVGIRCQQLDQSVTLRSNSVNKVRPAPSDAHLDTGMTVEPVLSKVPAVPPIKHTLRYWNDDGSRF